MSDYFVKLYASILDSSVWGEAAETRLVWITLLAMADQHGFVEASLPGLARRANVSLEACTSALGVLSSPDPHSKSEEHGGRRVEKVTRGWLVLNYERYRELRTRSQDDAARRKREQRARERIAQNGQGGETERDSHEQDVTVTPVTDASTSTSTSPSSSVVDLQKQELQQKPVRREGGDLAALDAHGLLAEWAFGPFAPIVDGFLRSQRVPIAVAQTLRMHLTGEMNHEKGTPEQVGLALQQYAAAEQGTKFNPRYFAGFVRDVKKQIERGGNRKRNDAEQKTLDEEQRAAEERKREEADGRRITLARRDHPERFAELLAIAEGQVPKKFSEEMREHMIYPVLLNLVRREWPDAR